MNVLGLFSGVGGFEIGLQRAGFNITAMCEIDPYCRKVLAKHWPDVPMHEDIQELDGSEYRGTVDVVCGGFPCQDISAAGLRQGIGGDRSGLWSEMGRVIGEVRPSHVIIENSPELAIRGLWDVLSDLAAMGFDAEWECIPACGIGATHTRERLWLVAYPNGLYGEAGFWGAFAQKERKIQPGCDFTVSRIGEEMGLEDASELYRGADDVPHRLERVRALGNAVVPQIPELIGRAILEAEKEKPPTAEVT